MDHFDGMAWGRESAAIILDRVGNDPARAQAELHNLSHGFGKDGEFANEMSLLLSRVINQH